MTINHTPLAGLYTLTLRPIVDERGKFMRLYGADELKDILSGRIVVQTNYSMNVKRGTIRGMHFQRPPKSETKIITCISGKVWDVAVDIRKQSPTYLQWFGVELSAENAQAVFIPEGFAHGFQTLEENSVMIYHHTQLYNPAYEGGLLFNDPALNIGWKLPGENISNKDKSYQAIDSGFEGIEI